MRIGIVNDLKLAVEALRRTLAKKPEHSIVWTATNGADAVARCAENPPDVVLMDLLMPGMDGVEATRQIMAKSPCAVLVVTAGVGDNASLVFEAMGHGALDAVDMPTLGLAGDGDSAALLLKKIELIGRLLGDRAVRAARRPESRPLVSGRQLLAIGASAGGPAALLQLLSGLPSDFPAAVVVIQHIDEKFAHSMADWLGRESPCPVRLAKPGDIPAPGTVLLAGTNEHLVLNADGYLDYTCEPVDQSYRPSVDVFFESVNRAWTGQAIGVLLTGMGRDGAAGLKAMRQKGHHTIAQDEASSAVYGMPKAAADLDAAVEILPIERIASRLRLHIAMAGTKPR
ncbi:MAG: chemotaxis response regulator protein-glutamate methylesterase [Pseudomonadota bacterium]|nr:chemotaxis response regulator protein-glutamate methylesterase [Pseudomonadota bacterium]MDQ3159635.1 chemotaxis response regulator protein-glutamate methylesterase [Pseudomonadota bacterium]